MRDYDCKQVKMNLWVKQGATQCYQAFLVWKKKGLMNQNRLSVAVLTIFEADGIGKDQGRHLTNTKTSCADTAFNRLEERAQRLQNLHKKITQRHQRLIVSEGPNAVQPKHNTKRLGCLVTQHVKTNYLWVVL